MGKMTSIILGRIASVVALSLLLVALAACGPSSESATESPVATAASPATEAAQTASDTTDAEPQGDIAPKFELPSGTGGTVSLASFAGDKNVVVVFYRGFW